MPPSLPGSVRPTPIALHGICDTIANHCILVLIAGTPLDQPIIQYGPFVLSSKEEVYQALVDYQTHSNGFERAKDWESEIGKSMER